MKLISVNVSLPKEVPHRNGTVTTGIFKEPVTGRVWLRVMNLDGDGQADGENHGGIYKAAYAYPIEHFDFWKRELGRNDWSRPESRWRPATERRRTGSVAGEKADGPILDRPMRTP